MPIYEYQCQHCGEPLEVIQKISDAPLRDCPACGRPELKKKVSAVAFRLKGSGWYETDFKTGGKRNVAGEGEAAGGKADAGKSDAGDAGGKSGGAAAGASASGGSKPESGGGKSADGKTGGSGKQSA